MPLVSRDAQSAGRRRERERERERMRAGVNGGDAVIGAASQSRSPELEESSRDARAKGEGGESEGSERRRRDAAAVAPQTRENSKLPPSLALFACSRRRRCCSCSALVATVSPTHAPLAPVDSSCQTPQHPFRRSSDLSLALLAHRDSRTHTLTHTLPQ